jgi:hypothetical protein
MDFQMNVFTTINNEYFTSRAGWQRYCCGKTSRRKCSDRFWGSPNLLFNEYQGGRGSYLGLTQPAFHSMAKGLSLSAGLQRPDCDLDDTLAFSAKVTNLGDILPPSRTCVSLWCNLHRIFEVTKHAINSNVIIELRMKVTNRTTWI